MIKNETTGGMGFYNKDSGLGGGAFAISTFDESLERQREEFSKGNTNASTFLVLPKQNTEIRSGY